MSNQQMILLFTGIAVVILAFVFAIRAVRAWEEDMNRTEMLDRLEQVRVDLCHFRMLPRSSGGGGGMMLGFSSSKLNKETEDYYFKTVKITKTKIEVEAYSKLYPSIMLKYTLQENVGSPCRNYPTVEYLDNFSFADGEGEDDASEETANEDDMNADKKSVDGSEQSGTKNAP
jgi:hypothetical protein